MSQEDQSSKTEQPTRRRLRDARKKGQVARSEEVVPLMMLVFTVLYFAFGWEWLSDHLKHYIESVSTLAYDRNFETALSTSMSVWFNDIIFAIMLPFSALMLVAGIVGNIVQFGFVFSFDPIIPKPEKINPAQGFKRVFSMKQVVKTLLSTFKIIIISIIIIFLVREAINEFIREIGRCDIQCHLDVFAELVKKLLFVLIPILIFMVMLDIAFQKFQFTKEQRMTKDEVKREHKSQEGDPIIKGQRRSEQRRLLQQDVREQIKQSRIVVAGMRKAAALMYEDDMPLPILLAIGRDRMSYQMIQIAKKENIPVVADPPLMMILESDGIIDQYIPATAIQRTARAMKQPRQS